MPRKRGEEDISAPGIYRRISSIPEGDPIIRLYKGLVDIGRLKDPDVFKTKLLSVGPDFLKSLGPIGSLRSFIDEFSLLRHVDRELIAVVNNDFIQWEVGSLFVDSQSPPLILALSGREGTFSGVRMGLHVVKDSEESRDTSLFERPTSLVGLIEHRWRRHEIDKSGAARLVLEPWIEVHLPYSEGSSPEAVFMYRIIGNFLDRMDAYQAGISLEERTKTIPFTEMVKLGGRRLRETVW